MTAPPISLRAYAKHRGVSPMAVSRAVASGRLLKSVVRDAGGAPKITDPKLADAEWEASTDLSRAPGYVKERAEAAPKTVEPSPPASEDSEAEPAELRAGMGLAQASAAEKFWAAKLKQQQFLERSGELVESSEVEEKLIATFTACRTKLLGVPSRARQQLPHLSVPDVAILERLIREALEDLAQESVAPAPSSKAAG